MKKPGFNCIGGQPGTYALILRNPGSNLIRAGRLGDLLLTTGIYVYIGSAFGPGGVAARCQHHARISTNPHWHIDYLRAAMELSEIWFSHDPQHREHEWADLMVKARGAQQPFPGFGSSDCNCLSHLFFFTSPPSFDSFRRRACRTLTNQSPILREILAINHGQTIE
jgi:Uri superfamily endonuclease